MDANGFLAVLAILVATYSLFPNEKRLDIRLRIYWLDFLFVGICVLAIMAIIFSPVLENLSLLIPMPWLFGFDGETTTFSCLLIIIVFFWIKITGKMLPDSKLSAWSEISERLLREKKFYELGYLFHKYHIQLLGIINHEPWYLKIRNFISPAIRLRIKLHGVENKLPFFESIIISIRVFLASLLPGASKKKGNVELSISRILKSKQFVSFLAEAHPVVAARSSCSRFNDNDEFISTFFTSLISHPNSPLYREIRDNQNCSYTGEYYIDDSNAILNFYFKDASVASQINLERPIGEYVIEFIQAQKGQDNFYNQACGHFSDGEERWSCPIFIGSLFFEIMISVTIFQRIKDHMWLMYCGNFIEEIIASYNPSSEVDDSYEFPTKFDYLLYNLFSTCGDWVGAIEYLDLTNVDNDEREMYPEFWAAKTFGSMLRKIIYTDKFTDRQKSYYLEIVIRRMKKLDQKNLNGYSQLIIDNCVKEYEHDPIDQDSIGMLDLHYKKVDHVLKSKISTFETLLNKYRAK